MAARQQVLHVGCGPSTRADMTPGFRGDDWAEVRLDIDPRARPDILGTMTDMQAVPSGSMDAVYSSHNLEHVFPHEVPLVLAEFHRVLRPAGFVVLTCPDLQTVAKAVAADRLLEPLYDSGLGPVSAMDILFGHRAELARGHHYMAHKCGFTYSTLERAFTEAGFPSTIGGRRPLKLDLWIMAWKAEQPEQARRAAAARYLPPPEASVPPPARAEK